MWSKRIKIPHLETVQSTVVVPTKKLPVGLKVIAAVGRNEAPRAVEIHNSIALLHNAEREPAAASTHCWIYKPPFAGTFESVMLTVAP